VAAAEALRIAVQWDSDYFIALARYGAGTVELNATNWPGAIAALEHALQLARTREIGIMLPAAGSALGLVQVHSQHADTGIPLLEEALAQVRAAGRTMWLGIFEYRMAEGYFVTGRLAEAQAALARAQAVATARGERMMVAWALWLEAELALAASDTAAAQATLGQAMTLGETLGLAPLVATCRASLAKCLRQQNDAPAADATLASAIESLHALGMTGRLKETAALLSPLPAE
jgi:tetratricopeptide (TPR) repeat protein